MNTSDLKKLKVIDLRKMVTDNNLFKGISKLKKAELVQKISQTEYFRRQKLNGAVNTVDALLGDVDGLTVSQLKQKIDLYKDRNCPSTTGLKKKELVNIVKNIEKKKKGENVDIGDLVDRDDDMVDKDDDEFIASPKQKLQIQFSKHRGEIRRFQGRYDTTKDEVVKADYLKKLNKAKKNLENVKNKLRKLIKKESAGVVKKVNKKINKKKVFNKKLIKKLKKLTEKEMKSLEDDEASLLKDIAIAKKIDDSVKRSRKSKKKKMLADLKRLIDSEPKDDGSLKRDIAFVKKLTKSMKKAKNAKKIKELEDKIRNEKVEMRILKNKNIAAEIKKILDNEPKDDGSLERDIELFERMFIDIKKARKKSTLPKDSQFSAVKIQPSRIDILLKDGNFKVSSYKNNDDKGRSIITSKKKLLQKIDSSTRQINILYPVSKNLPFLRLPLDALEFEGDSFKKFNPKYNIKKISPNDLKQFKNKSNIYIDVKDQSKIKLPVKYDDIIVTKRDLNLVEEDDAVDILFNKYNILIEASIEDDEFYLNLFVSQDDVKKPRAPRGWAYATLCKILRLCVKLGFITDSSSMGLQAVPLGSGNLGGQQKLNDYYKSMGLQKVGRGSNFKTTVKNFIDICHSKDNLGRFKKSKKWKGVRKADRRSEREIKRDKAEESRLENIEKARIEKLKESEYGLYVSGEAKKSLRTDQDDLVMMILFDNISSLSDFLKKWNARDLSNLFGESLLTNIMKNIPLWQKMKNLASKVTSISKQISSNPRRTVKKISKDLKITFNDEEIDPAKKAKKPKKAKKAKKAKKVEKEAGDLDADEEFENNLEMLTLNYENVKQDEKDQIFDDERAQKIEDGVLAGSDVYRDKKRFNKLSNAKKAKINMMFDYLDDLS
jgi:hypothetical protein